MTTLKPPIPYHPHIADLARVISEHGCGRIRNGHVIICRAVDSMAPKRDGFIAGAVGIWGIAYFAWFPNLTDARRYGASLLRFLPRRRAFSAVRQQARYNAIRKDIQ